jgi:hypothetical protein
VRLCPPLTAHEMLSLRQTQTQTPYANNWEGRADHTWAGKERPPLAWTSMAFWGRGRSPRFRGTGSNPGSIWESNPGRQRTGAGQTVTNPERLATVGAWCPAGGKLGEADAGLGTTVKGFVAGLWVARAHEALGVVGEWGLGLRWGLGLAFGAWDGACT